MYTRQERSGEAENQEMPWTAPRPALTQDVGMTMHQISGTLEQPGTAKPAGSQTVKHNRPTSDADRSSWAATDLPAHVDVTRTVQQATALPSQTSRGQLQPNLQGTLSASAASDNTPAEDHGGGSPRCLGVAVNAAHASIHSPAYHTDVKHSAPGQNVATVSPQSGAATPSPSPKADCVVSVPAALTSRRGGAATATTPAGNACSVNARHGQAQPTLPVRPTGSPQCVLSSAAAIEQGIAKPVWAGPAPACRSGPDCDSTPLDHPETATAVTAVGDTSRGAALVAANKYPRPSTLGIVPVARAAPRTARSPRGGPPQQGYPGSSPAASQAPGMQAQVHQPDANCTNQQLGGTDTDAPLTASPAEQLPDSSQSPGNATLAQQPTPLQTTETAAAKNPVAGPEQTHTLRTGTHMSPARSNTQKPLSMAGTTGRIAGANSQPPEDESQSDGGQNQVDHSAVDLFCMVSDKGSQDPASPLHAPHTHPNSPYDALAPLSSAQHQSCGSVQTCSLPFNPQPQPGLVRAEVKPTYALRAAPDAQQRSACTDRIPTDTSTQGGHVTPCKEVVPMQHTESGTVEQTHCPPLVDVLPVRPPNPRRLSLGTERRVQVSEQLREMFQALPIVMSRRVSGVSFTAVRWSVLVLSCIVQTNTEQHLPSYNLC